MVFRYLKGTIQGSINSPFSKSFNADGTLLSSQVKDFLDNHKYQVKVIVDNSNAHAGKVSSSSPSLVWIRIQNNFMFCK